LRLCLGAEGNPMRVCMLLRGCHCMCRTLCVCACCCADAIACVGAVRGFCHFHASAISMRPPSTISMRLPFPCVIVSALQRNDSSATHFLHVMPVRQPSSFVCSVASWEPRGHGWSCQEACHGGLSAPATASAPHRRSRCLRAASTAEDTHGQVSLHVAGPAGLLQGAGSLAFGNCCRGPCCLPASQGSATPGRLPRRRQRSFAKACRRPGQGPSTHHCYAHAAAHLRVTRQEREHRTTHRHEHQCKHTP
jgi:hypothetical protein